MCGIAGIYSGGELSVDNFERNANRFQIHRGPDFQSFRRFETGNAILSLIHQRLSILDLSSNGNQPMSSACNGYHLVYNGEIFNYKELYGELNIESLRSSSDTEVLLEIIAKFGVRDALNRFNGMWAFALYDQKNRKLILARDRFGVKPLYYFRNGKDLYFSSELKTITHSVDFRFTLNYQALGEFVQQSLQDTTESSFFNEIKSVPAGCFLEFNLDDFDQEPLLHKYWVGLEEECEERLTPEEVYKLFDDSVRIRMRSDVPVGLTLSGGIDSSAIAAMMTKHAADRSNINVLSIVSPGSNEDESEFVDLVANHLGLNVTKIELDWDKLDIDQLISRVTWHNDAPIGSFSNLAHFLLMEEAHKLGIKVILSGQGADEVLCGYKKYVGFYSQFLYRQKKFLKLSKLLFGFFFNRSVLNQFRIAEAKRYLPRLFKLSNETLLGEELVKYYSPVKLGLKASQDIVNRQIEDIEKFSVPYLTHYEDRMSMAFSTEIRLPFLDYRFVKRLTKAPIDLKLSKGWTKYIFRRAISKSLPSKIVWRKDKMGFTMPQDKWLRSTLKPQILSYFNEEALIFKLGLINRKKLLDNYESFCSRSLFKKSIWYREIFAPFALEVWLQQNKDVIKIDEKII